MELNDIYRLIEDELEEVEQSLEVVADVDSPLLAELLKYTLKGGGKRIRPALTLLAGKFHLYDSALLIPMAVAIELLHTATLVHDDIVDGSPVRRGKPTVSRAWGENKALLLGDYLFAKAGSLAASTGNLRIIKLFSQTLMAISSGELAQISVSFDLPGARECYFNWISAKTASLFATATESGAVLSRSPEATVQALKDYGHNFGMAFQIVDDVLDFIGEEVELGKPVGSDLGEGIATLPSILFLESHPEDSLIRGVFGKRNAESVPLAVDAIRRSPAIDECLALASDFCARACRALDKLPDNNFRQALLDLASYIVQRHR
ncbi:MAG TPA: polyprenyl synthetase family protein [Dehalococcoidia bacterium]|nr:polyprenyl synthetase family protein [Dehalococcoidia bacterium]